MNRAQYKKGKRNRKNKNVRDKKVSNNLHFFNKLIHLPLFNVDIL